MKAFFWDGEKNELLKRERGVSFEEVVYHIHNGDLLAKLAHPNLAKFSHQQVFILDMDGYVYMVPFVEDKEKYFLKTIIPGRKLTREYLGRKEGPYETE